METLNYRIWSEGEKFRLEGTSGLGEVVSVSDGTTCWLYLKKKNLVLTQEPGKSYIFESESKTYQGATLGGATTIDISSVELFSPVYIRNAARRNNC